MGLGFGFGVGFGSGLVGGFVGSGLGVGAGAGFFSGCALLLLVEDAALVTLAALLLENEAALEADCTEETAEEAAELDELLLALAELIGILRHMTFSSVIFEQAPEVFQLGDMPSSLQQAADTADAVDATELRDITATADADAALAVGERVNKTNPMIFKDFKPTPFPHV